MALAGYVAAVLADTPRVYWKLDETSGFPADSSGNSLPITTTDGSPAYLAQGPMSSVAIQFDGLTMAFSRAVASTVTDNFTIEAWVYLTALNEGAGTSEWIYTCGTPAASNGFGVGFNTSGGSSVFLLGVAHNIGFTTLGTTEIVLNRWTHCVWRRQATTWRYFLDGTIDPTSGGTISPGAVSGSTFINRTATLLTNGPSGRLAHMAVYETALSDSTILAHYQSSAEIVHDPFLRPHPVMGRGASW
jgi:hypothetical protein